MSKEAEAIVDCGLLSHRAGEARGQKARSREKKFMFKGGGHEDQVLRAIRHGEGAKPKIFYPTGPIRKKRGTRKGLFQKAKHGEADIGGFGNEEAYFHAGRKGNVTMSTGKNPHSGVAHPVGVCLTPGVES